MKKLYLFMRRFSLIALLVFLCCFARESFCQVTNYSITSQQPINFQFYPNSLFTKSLPSNIMSHLAANSDSIIISVFGSSPSTAAYTVIATGQNSAAGKGGFYYSTVANPIYEVVSATNPASGTNAHNPVGVYFHLPSGATFPGTTADQGVNFWDQSVDIDATPGGRILSLYQFDTGATSLPTCTCTTTSCANTTSSCQIAANYAGYGYPLNDPIGTNAGNPYVSAGYAPGAGILRSAELLAAQTNPQTAINHTLLGEYSCAPPG